MRVYGGASRAPGGQSCTAAESGYVYVCMKSRVSTLVLCVQSW